MSLTRAFKEMRRKGLVARQNFSCCGGCAGGEIATYVSKLPEAKFRKVKGSVFYHAQAAADKRRGEDFYMSFGKVTCTNGRETQHSTKEVGWMVCECLIAAGIDHEWTGDPTVGIKIIGQGQWRTVSYG